MTRGLWKFVPILVLGTVWGGHAAAQDAAQRAEEAAKKTEAAAEKIGESAKEMKEAAKEATDAANKIARSGDDFSGDRLTLRTTVYGFELARDINGGEDRAIKNKKTAPAGTRLRVLHDTEAGLLVAIESISCVAKEAEPDSNAKDPLKATDPLLAKLGIAASAVKCGDFNFADLVKPGEAYHISKKTISDHGFNRSGWVYGALLVPYKYHRHDKSFGSAATIGPYLGYRLDGLGLNSAFIVSVGIASLSVQNEAGATSTLQGYTTAIGLIASVTKNKNPMRLGVMLGRDWAGSNSPVPYEHEGRTWLAVQIGFSFSE